MRRSGLSHVRRNLVIILALFIFSAIIAYAFDWPSSAGSYQYGFGSIRNGFLRGTELTSSNGIVQSSDEGELIFSSESELLPGGYPLHGGSILAIAHSDDMMTIYSGLEPGSLSTYLKLVKKGDALGRGSGPEKPGGATIYVFDKKERQYINPIIVMPRFADEKAPVIRSVSLSRDGMEFFLASQKMAQQGTYDLLLDTYDLSPSGSPSAPYDIRILVDGSERVHLVYDAVWSTAGTSKLFGSMSLVENSFVMPDGRLRFGPYTLPRGRFVLTVIVADYAGNTREQTYALSIQ